MLISTPLTPVKNAFSSGASLKSRAHSKAFERALEVSKTKVPWFWSDSAAIKTLIQDLFYATKIAHPILIQGSTGTGKEIVARFIHQVRLELENGTSADCPWIAINSASIPENLAESILFGHERGAFTSARERQSGKFEIASRGTLFIDEIQLLPIAVQGKLLRTLQQGEFETLGGKKTLPVRCRVIVATNRAINELTDNNSFREDLYYRLSASQVYVPSLNERKSELEQICLGFLKQFQTQFETVANTFHPDTLNILKNYDWKGNLRELEYTLLYSAIRSKEIIHPSDLHSKFKYPR